MGHTPHHSDNLYFSINVSYDASINANPQGIKHLIRFAFFLVKNGLGKKGLRIRALTTSHESKVLMVSGHWSSEFDPIGIALSFGHNSV